MKICEVDTVEITYHGNVSIEDLHWEALLPLLCLLRRINSHEIIQTSVLKPGG